MNDAPSSSKPSAWDVLARADVLSGLLFVAIAVFGLLMPGIDNYAHLGGFACGFLLGRMLPDRKPADTAELNLAQAMGWAAGFAVLASFAFMLLNYFGSMPRGL